MILKIHRKSQITVLALLLTILLFRGLATDSAISSLPETATSSTPELFIKILNSRDYPTGEVTDAGIHPDHSEENSDHRNENSDHRNENSDHSYRNSYPSENSLQQENSVNEENSISSGSGLTDIPLPDSGIGQSLATYNLTDGLVLWMHFNNEEAYGEGGIELPNNQADSYVNMTGNVLLIWRIRLESVRNEKPSVSHLHFNNDSSYGENNTHVYDFSGMGNNGTVTNATWTSSGKFGGAFEFDGDGGSGLEFQHFHF